MQPIFFAGNDKNLLSKLSQALFHLFHHLAVLLSLGLLLLNLCRRSLAHKFLIFKHTVDPRQLFFQPLFLLLKPFNLLGDIHQLRKWHIDGGLRNHR